MSQQGIIQQFLADALEAALKAGGPAFEAPGSAPALEAAITLTAVQRRQLVRGLDALRGVLAAAESEQLVADELAIFCHKLANTKGRNGQ